jgi:antitoxin component of MazEF toxin-antitoxin module
VPQITIKITPSVIERKDEETVVLVANRRFGWVDCDEHVTELAPRIATHDEWKKSKMTAHDWE